MSQISSAKAALNLPPPIEDDPEQPDRQAQTDALVAINRASTPPAAVNQRRVQRLSIAELNQRDMDDLKARLAKIDDRDRTPLEKVLDLIDLPRNTVANIAVGKPTAGGVAGLIGGPAAAGAAVGALGGPVGAGVGAAVGAGFGAAAGLVGLAGRALGSSGFREDVQKGAAPGGIGAAEQPRIQTSDILRSLGVKNRVVNGLVGFAGDVAFDPITYVGPAGWGTKIVGQKAGQSLILRGAEARGLRRAIAASAKGTAPAARDAHWAEYLASRGLAKAENETADAALDRISRTVMGSQQTGGSALIENVFRPLGGDRVRKGGTLLEDFYAPVVDGPAVAARSAVERSLKGSGPSLKFGLGDDTGVEVLHLPFTDRTVQIPGYTSAVRSTRANQAIARLRDLGAGRAVVESATASEVFGNAVKAADLTQEHSDLSARVAEYTDRIRMMDENTPPPIDGAPLIDPAKTALYHAAEQAKRRQQDILDQMTYLVNRQDELLSQVNPADAAKSLTSAQDVLAQVDARRMALDMLEEARSQQWSLQNASNFPHINAMEPEEAAAQIGEDLYHLAINKPDAVLELADLNAKRMKAVQAAANALDAPLSQLLHSDDRQMVNFAKSFIGIDDDAVAVSAFGKIHDALIENWDADAEHALMRRLYATDQWWRNVFGARGGSTARKIAQETARRTNSTDEARRAREALQQQVTTKLADAGIDAGREQLPDAMQYVHMRAHELADPTGGAYHTWEWSDAGPKIGPDGKLTNPSLLRQRIEKLAADGLLVNPAARQALDQIAASIAPAYRQALYAGQDARMLGLGVEGYVGTNKYVDDVQQAIDSLAKETGGSQTGFLGPRSTHQVRYLDPATGKWRRFFAFDQSLIDEFPDPVKVRVPDRFDSAGNPLPPLPADKYAEKTAAEKIREHYKHDGKLASQVAEARDAAIRYNQLAKADPNFAATYPPHPTDPIELNAVAQTGRFDRLTGGKRDVSDFFDSDAGVVVEAYFATAQRAIAKRNMTRLIGDNGFSVNPEHLNNIRNATGRTVPLANGVEATIIPAMKSSLGNEVAAVKIGDTTFRRLDPEVAQKFSAELLGLADQDIQGKLLHPVLADRIEDFAKTFNAHGFEQVLNGLDKINSVWKMATLTHPSWPIFNLVGNSVNAITGGAKPEHMLDPRRWSETFAAIFRPDIEGSITAGGVKYTRKEFLDLAHDLGVRKNNLSLEAAAQFARATPGWSNYTDKHLKWLSAWFRANQNMDDVSRLQAFRSFLDQGFSLEAAAQKTLFAMFDFADFTGIEKNIFKRLIPFYSWMRSNLGYQLNLLMQRPMYAAMAPRLRQSLEDAIAGDSAVPQEMRPSWMRDALAAQIGSDPEGRFGLLLGNGVLPQTDIYNLMLPLVGAEGALKFLHYFTSSLSPTLTTPLQLGAGTEFFSGRSIGADIGADIKPGEFLASQFRPYAEYAPGGKVPRAFAQGTAQGVARALVGGRVQSMDEERVLSSREHELRVTEEKLRSGIRRAERIGDPSASANARAELLALYRKMQRLGFDVPNWAEEQLAPSQESQPIPSPA